MPIIAIPTTAGTAAEVTINYVITDEAKKRKFVCVDVHDVPAVALVNPDMMESMPKSLAAATGMDALTHAIEGYITKAAWELTDALHLKAIELIGRSLRGAVEKNPKMSRQWHWDNMWLEWASPTLGLARFTVWHTRFLPITTPHTALPTQYYCRM